MGASFSCKCLVMDCVYLPETDVNKYVPPMLARLLSDLPCSQMHMLYEEL